MTHIDADMLVAIALGGPSGAPEHRHLSAPRPPSPRPWQAIDEAIRREGASGGLPVRDRWTGLRRDTAARR